MPNWKRVVLAVLALPLVFVGLGELETARTLKYGDGNVPLVFADGLYHPEVLAIWRAVAAGHLIASSIFLLAAAVLLSASLRDSHA